MSTDKSLQLQIEDLCKQYNVSFSLDAFLGLIIFAARSLGTLEKGQSPITIIEDGISAAHKCGSRGQLDKLNGLLGTLATVFHYLKTELGELLYYREFIELIEQYIGERDPRFKREMETEQTIFLSMVYQPMKWYRLFGRYESEIQVRDVHLKFSDIVLPNLRTIRGFIMNYLTQECGEQLKIFIRANSMFKQNTDTKLLLERKSEVQLATRLLTWLNDRTSRLNNEDLTAVKDGKLADLEDHLQPIMMKRCF